MWLDEFRVVLAQFDEWSGRALGDQLLLHAADGAE